MPRVSKERVAFYKKLYLDGKKYCPRCDTIKTLAEFNNNKSRWDKKTAWCKHCEAQYKKENYHNASAKSKRKYKERYKSAELKRDYGITIEEKRTIKSSQNNLCAICGIKFENDSHACVDHDHKTGFVRGLLCSKCNTILGFANDDISILNMAIVYLEEANEYQEMNLIR